MNTYDEDYEEKKKWFRNNDKLVIVRYNDEQQGYIIGLFYDDITALEYIENQMKGEGKYLATLAMPWMEFPGYLNTKNNSFKHKMIKNACYRDKVGTLDTQICFWFQIVENNCLL